VAEIKEMGYMLLLLLVSISAMYEWAMTEPTIGPSLGVDSVEGYSGGDFASRAVTIQSDLVATETVELTAQTEPLALGAAAIATGVSLLGLMFSLLFGWTALVTAIFKSIGVESMALVITAPIGALQVFTIFYLIIDVVKAVWKA